MDQLQSSPDDRGILISAGKPHHVGTMTIMLHVSGETDGPCEMKFSMQIILKAGYADHGVALLVVARHAQ